MKKNNDAVGFIKVLGLALLLPSAIMGIYFIVEYLTQKNYISRNAGIYSLLAFIAVIFGLMVKYALVKQNKD